MSDGINDAEGRRTDYDRFRAKHKGKWGIWDCGYFYADPPKKRKRKVSFSTYVLRAYDDDFPSTLFAGWLTIKKFKARHIAHARTLGRKIAKKLRWQVWKVHKAK